MPLRGHSSLVPGRMAKPGPDTRAPDPSLGSTPNDVTSCMIYDATKGCQDILLIATLTTGLSIYRFFLLFTLQAAYND